MLKANRIISMVLVILMLVSTNTIVLGADEIIIDQRMAQYTESGTWKDGGLKGYDGQATRFCSSGEGYAQWSAEAVKGEYDVYIFKIYHEKYSMKQVVEVVSQSGTDAKESDFSVAPSGWEYIGRYKFSGTSSEYIKTYKPKTAALSTARANAVKFVPATGVAPAPAPSATVPVPAATPSAPTTSAPALVNTPDGIIISHTMPQYSESGSWKEGGMKGFDGNMTRFCSTGEGFAKWSIEGIAAGTYDVYIYKIYHDKFSAAQAVEISSKDGIISTEADFTKSPSEWLMLGTYNFSGGSDEFVKTLKSKTTTLSTVRANAIKLVPSNKVVATQPKSQISDEGAVNIPPVYKNDGIKIFINGLEYTFDPPPTKVNDRTLVPMRGIFEALNAKIEWEEATETVTATKGDIQIKLQIGNTTAYINGEATILDVAPMLISERTMVPTRFVSEALDATVEWEEATQSVLISTGAIKATSLFQYPSDVKEKGDWNFDNLPIGSIGSSVLIGKVDKKPDGLRPALFEFDIYEDGIYSLYVRSKDYNVSQGTRFFQIALNDVPVPHEFGKHAVNGWSWEKVGPFNIKQGTLQIELFDTSAFYARLDGLYLTKDGREPPMTNQEAVALVNKINPLADDLKTPEYAKSQNEPISTFSLVNNNINIEFYTVPTNEGNVIQKKTMINNNGNFVTTSGRENILGNLLMYAKTAEQNQMKGQFPVFSTEFYAKGINFKRATADIFKSGMPYWAIPSGISKISDTELLMSAVTDVAEVTWLWTLNSNDEEPTITATIKPLVNGVFSLSLMSGAERSVSQTDFVLTPYRFIDKRLPDESYIVSDMYYTSPISLITNTNNGLKVTSGVALDPGSVNMNWIKAQDISHGFGIKGPTGGVVPYLTAPLPGTSMSKMTQGSEYKIKYKIIERIGDWFPTYTYAQEKLFGFKDYRKNYYGTLNDAIFNTWKLALDDYYGGWDDEMKGFYNVESRQTVTMADPLALLSSYLLSGDQEMLDKRVIPTLASVLTRENAHFTNDVGSGSANFNIKSIMPIGKETRIFKNTAYGGIYNMTGGLSGAFYDVGVAKEQPLGSLTFNNPIFVEYAWLYKYTQKSEYELKAKQYADEYIKKFIDTPQTSVPTEDMFIGFDYYPPFFAFLDMYEIFGDKKYLDAAQESAHWLLPTIWSYQNGDGEITLSGEKVKNDHISKDYYGRWAGDEKFRLGYPEKLDELKDETLPFWLLSRSGLSLEQSLTFTAHKGGNMIMANWAPELMRLAEYTGDKLFETYARNAVVGRHTVYPGYYYNQYWNKQMQPNYPYEGPDITLVYFHHIAPFLSMIQDFIFTQSWSWSNKNISFPKNRLRGYLYFINAVYGGEAGTFFDESGMFPWLKKGLIETNSIQIDWIGARKDGTAGFALMNEDDIEQTVTVKIGNEVVPNYSGAVTVYDADGNKSTTEAKNGYVSITVPSKGLTAFTIKSPSIKAPTRIDSTSTPSENTVVRSDNGEFGNGMILQITPESYHAYIYVTDKPDKVESVTLRCASGDKCETVVDKAYPFEFIKKVANPKADFKYTLEIKYTDGKVAKSKEFVLSPKTK